MYNWKKSFIKVQIIFLCVYIVFPINFFLSLFLSSFLVLFLLSPSTSLISSPVLSFLFLFPLLSSLLSSPLLFPPPLPFYLITTSVLRRLLFKLLVMELLKWFEKFGKWSVTLFFLMILPFEKKDSIRWFRKFNVHLRRCVWLPSMERTKSLGVSTNDAVRRSLCMILITLKRRGVKPIFSSRNMFL